MKQIKCSEMGGPADCNVIITANTAQEMIGSGWEHMQVEHPTDAARIEAQPKEVNDKWMADFSSKFETLQEA